MGQCVLRDIGFEFEDDAEKKRAFEEYLNAKANVKYPDLYLPKTAENDEEDGSEWGEGRRSTKGGEALYGRVTTLLNKMVQTDDLDEEQFRDLDDAVQVGAEPNIDPQELRNHLELAARSGKSGEDDSSGYKQYRQEPLKLSSSGFIDNTPVAGAKTYSPNTGIRQTLAKMPPIGSTQNIFDGLESIDFRSPGGGGASANKEAGKGGYTFNNPLPASSEAVPLRSRMAQYKGFENKYFRISHNRSPSPMAQSQNIFDDDDDDFPYDDDY